MYSLFKKDKLFLIAGPCVIESKKHCLAIARELAAISEEVGIDLIFKASFDKANRTKWHSYRGLGILEGLTILKQVHEETRLPVTTDVHRPEQVSMVAKVVDLLQVPALLCKQTDLITACAKTGKPMNVKKGQFLSPEGIADIDDEVGWHDVNTIAVPTGRLMFTERGSCFGYNNLVADMTAIPIMQKTGYPIVFDASHSTKREMTPTLAKAAVAAGADGLFIEVHNNPSEAKCDGASSLHIKDLKELILTCQQIYDVVH